MDLCLHLALHCLQFDVMAAADAVTVLQACQQAAQAASQAAQALRDANERRGNSYGEASKVIQCPKEFGSINSNDDQTRGLVRFFICLQAMAFLC